MIFLRAILTLQEFHPKYINLSISFDVVPLLIATCFLKTFHSLCCPQVHP
jgi:hypothetical protein